MIKHKGFTLIELLIFIVVVSIVAVTLLSSTAVTLRHLPIEHNQTKALNISTKCMEYFLGQRYLKSFASVVNDTAAQNFCNLLAPSNFSVTTTITDFTVPNFSETQAFKLITIDTTGPGKSTMKMIIADY